MAFYLIDPVCFMNMKGVFRHRLLNYSDAAKLSLRTMVHRSLGHPSSALAIILGHRNGEGNEDVLSLHLKGILGVTNAKQRSFGLKSEITQEGGLKHSTTGSRD